VRKVRADLGEEAAEAMGRLWLVLSFLLLCADVGLFQNADDAAEECVAMARASTNPNMATTDAVANAVAETFSKSVKCDEEKGGLNDTEVPGLSIAIALAISEAEDVAQECTSDADAQANLTAMAVADDIREVLGEATNETTDEDKISQARVDALTRDLEGSIMNETETTMDGEVPGIVPLSVPTADEVAKMVEEAIQDILLAIQCGEEQNVEPGEEGVQGECIFLNGRFIGDCLKERTPEPPAATGSPSGPSVATENDGGEDQPRCIFLNGRLIC